LHGVVFAVLREPEPALPKSSQFHIERLTHSDRTPDGHRHATKSPDDSTRLVLHGLAVMRMGAVMMRWSDLQLTPARVGLLLLVALLLGAMVVRVTIASEDSEVRPPSTPESGERVTPNTGVRGLRGSLE
jgi:hypothetical protein